MSIVVANLQKEMEPIAIAYANDPEKNKDRLRAIISCRRYLLGLIAGAAGLMCGFFDAQRTEASFEKLSHLLISDHPIPAVRFFKMDLTMNELIYTLFEDADMAELLLSSTDAFSVDIFMHKNQTLDIRNCFWAPVQTKEAQDFIVLLEKSFFQYIAPKIETPLQLPSVKEMKIAAVLYWFMFLYQTEQKWWSPCSVHFLR